MEHGKEDIRATITKKLRLVKIRHDDGTFETVRRIDLTPEQRKQADLAATNLLRHLLKNGRIR